MGLLNFAIPFSHVFLGIDGATTCRKLEFSHQNAPKHGEKSLPPTYWVNTGPYPNKFKHMLYSYTHEN